MSEFSDELERIENLVGEIAPFLNEYWSLGKDEELSGEEIEVLTKKEFMDLYGLNPEQNILPENDFFGTYTGEDQSYLYFEPDNIAEADRDISPSEIGEELSHIAHQRSGRATSQYLGRSMDSGPEDYEEINMEDWLMASSVSEFIGRLGAINTSIEFGGELPEDKAERPETEDVDLTAEQLYEHIKEKDLMSISYYDTWQKATHEAGYRAAEKNIQKANSDPGLIYRNPEKIWNEYNIEKELIDAVDTVWGL